MIISWYDVTTKEPGGDTLAICLLCAAKGVDDDMVCIAKSLEVENWDEDLYCEVCGELVAKATMPE